MNHYQMLGLKTSATIQEIKKAFRDLAKKYHPDKNPGNEIETTKHFRKLLEAYDTLSNPNKRVLYDKTIKKENPKPIVKKTVVSSLDKKTLKAMMAESGLTEQAILNIWKNDPNLGKVWSAPPPKVDLWGQPLDRDENGFIDVFKYS